MKHGMHIVIENVIKYLFIHSVIQRRSRPKPVTNKTVTDGDLTNTNVGYFRLYQDGGREK